MSFIILLHSDSKVILLVVMEIVICKDNEYRQKM
jgi:hypothetical protein